MESIWDGGNYNVRIQTDAGFSALTRYYPGWFRVSGILDDGQLQTEAAAPLLLALLHLKLIVLSNLLGLCHVRFLCFCLSGFMSLDEVCFFLLQCTDC